MFWVGFEKRAAEREVAKAAILYKGRLLMGVRQDTGKWTEPGGHLNEGESPIAGVLREVREETGIQLKAEDMKLLGSEKIESPKKLTVHVFKSELKKEPRIEVSKDPDHEVFGWNWVPLKSNRLPEIINRNLHVPPDRNCIHKFMGIK